MYPLNQPEVMISNAAERFDGQGHLTDERVADTNTATPEGARGLDAATEN